MIIAIFGILLTLLLPSLSTAKEKAKIAVCFSNMKQLYTLTNMFRSNNNSAMPAQSGDEGRFTDIVDDDVESTNKSGLSVIPEIIQYSRGYPAGRAFWSKKHKYDDFFCPNSVVVNQQPGGGDLRQTGYGFNYYAWSKGQPDDLKFMYPDKLEANNGASMSEWILYSESAWFSTVKQYTATRDEGEEEYINIKWHYRLDHMGRNNTRTLNNMYFDGHMKTLSFWLNVEEMASTQWGYFKQN